MTIYIDKNTSNTFSLTLSERSPNPLTSYYFMKIIGNDNNDERTFYLGPDLSAIPNRKNTFTIIDNVNEDLDNQIVDFNQSSFDYFVYYSPTDDIADIDKLVEVGQIKVNDISPIIESTYNNTNNEYTYNG